MEASGRKHKARTKKSEIVREQGTTRLLAHVHGTGDNAVGVGGWHNTKQGGLMCSTDMLQEEPRKRIWKVRFTSNQVRRRKASQVNR